MSDPVTYSDIEDVLSSIRRLVSEDSRPKPEKPARTEKLVLTPALRIGNGSRDAKEAEPRPEDKPDAEPLVDTRVLVGEAHRLLAEHVDEFCDTLVFGNREGPHETAREPVKEDARHPEFDPSEEEDTEPAEMSGETTLERKIAALERLVSETDDRSEWDAEPEPANRRALFQHNPPPALAWQTAASRNGHAAKTDDATVESHPPDDGGARTASTERAVTEDQGQTRDSDAPSQQPVMVEMKRDTTETAQATSPEQRATPIRGRDDTAASVAPPARDRKKDDGAIDLLAEDGQLSIDEEMLREMVAEIVREELQGALGERITRNVRKLVRREIHRVLVSKDFD